MTTMTVFPAATHCSSPRKGFTLIEMMIVVAILAILASLAYFNYSKFAYRSRRADGKEMLTRVASAQERYYTNFNSYAPDVGTLGFTAAAPCNLLGSSDKCYYQISTANGASGDSQSYMVTAVPVLGKAQEPTAAAIDTCQSLTLTNQGVKSQTGSATLNGPCW